MLSIHQNPFRLVSGLHRDVNRLLRAETGQGRHYVPAVDIYEEASRYVVEADLPGVDADAIEITVDGDLLTIRGERKARAADEKATLQRAERASGPFERVFRLPESASSKGVEADYRHGVLSVSIPRAAEATPYRIEVTQN